MRNGYVLRRALLGLCAATLGGVAASAGAVHLRSQLTETAQATTFSCTQRPLAHHGSSRIQAALSTQPGTSAVCKSTRPYMVRVSGTASANQPPVVAVLVPVQGHDKTYRAKVILHGSRQSGIFVDAGSVTYGGVTYCSQNCPTDAEHSHTAIVPVTIVNVAYNGEIKKVAAKP